MRDVLEDRQSKDSWALSSFHDVTLLAMEEMSLRLPNSAEVQGMLLRASQEFEESRRGVTITSDGITVIGRKA
jgi:hypothetical protein